MANEGAAHANHRQRLRDRLLSCGASSLSDHELLELLLFTPIPRRSTNLTAHLLIDRFGSLEEVLDAPVEELAKVEGMGPASAQFLHNVGRAVRGFVQNFIDNPIVFASPEDTFRFASEYFRIFSAAKGVYIALDAAGQLITVCELPAEPVSRDLLTAMLQAPAYGVIILLRAAALPSAATCDVYRQTMALMNTQLVDVVSFGDRPLSLFAQHSPSGARYARPQELEGAVAFHAGSQLGDSSYDEPPEQELPPHKPFGDYDLADAIPAGSIAAQLAGQAPPTPSGEGDRLISAARARKPARTRRGEELSPELDALIGPYVDPEGLDDTAFAIFKQEVERQKKSE